MDLEAIRILSKRDQVRIICSVDQDEMVLDEDILSLAETEASYLDVS